MRLLHTSDWHLGKKLFRLDRSEEHARFLDWLLSIIQKNEIDILLIAGDIFDTPTPPHQSLEMFYEFLHRLSSKTKVDTYIIAGNHDSGLLLEAPAGLLKTHRVKVWGKLSPNPIDHWTNIIKGNEKLDLCGLPFFRSYELLPQGEGDALTALKRYLQKEKSCPQLLMLHHLAGMAEAAGSEQVIALTGMDSIPLNVMETFDYVALGHIHKPQKMREGIYYSGSPLAMRFSETHPKSVMQLELKDNKITTTKIDVPLFRKLLNLKLDEENWGKAIESIQIDSELPAVAEVQIYLTGPQIGLVDKIRSLLAAKGIELLSYLPSYSKQDNQQKKNNKLFELSPTELFKEFYSHKFPESAEVPGDLLQDFKELVQKVNHAATQAKD